MTIKKDGRGRIRDYDAEYSRDHSSKKDKQDRAARNAARAKLKIGPSRNRQVHHKDGNPRNNARSNLMIMSRKRNTTLSNKGR